MADFEAVDRDLAALASAVPDVRALIERYGERDLRLSNVDAVLAALGDASVIDLAQDEPVSTDTLVDRPSFLPLGWVPESEASADAEADAEAELQVEAELAASLAAPGVPDDAEQVPSEAPEAVEVVVQEPGFAASTPDVTVVSAAPLEGDELAAGDEPSTSVESVDAGDEPAASAEAVDAGDEPATSVEAADALDAAVDAVLSTSQRAASQPPASEAPAAPASQRPPRATELHALLDEAINPSDFDAPRPSTPASAPSPVRSSFPPRPRGSSAPPRSSAPPPLPPVPRPSLPVPAAEIPDVDELELLVDDEDIIEISEDA